LSPGGPKRSGGGAQRLDQATTSATPRDHVRAIALGAIETPRFSMIVSILELAWLTELERGPAKTVGPFSGDTPERRLAIHLVAEGFACELERYQPVEHWTQVEQRAASERWNSIRELRLGKRSISLSITHAGAVRRAELEEQLQTGRIKEPMELLWDGRHFRRDARIALLDVTTEQPLVVAFLDLNDVKKVFNKRSRETGDAAIRRYLELIADVATDRGDAYRLSGGADEVVILLPRFDLERGLQTVRVLLKALGREQVEGYSLRAAAGVVMVTAAEDVNQLRARVDREQVRAKNASDGIEGRPSVLAWPPDKLEVISLPE
jgi:GGDEF domain-containing protein